LGIPVEIVQFLLKLLLKQISSCVPRFLLILTAKFHSLCLGVRHFGKSESEILEMSELDILPPTPQPCCLLVLRWLDAFCYFSSITSETSSNKKIDLC